MSEFLNKVLLHIGNTDLTMGNLLMAVLVLLVARLVSFVFAKTLHQYALRRKIDAGREYAARTLVIYFLYTIAVFLSIQALGVSVNMVWAGAAALFVGLGFGIQQIFNDIVSGLILLIEGTVEVNDVVIVDGIVGVVVKIGLRTSQVETRDRVVMIIPNSKLVSENVVNWSHNKTYTRFHVDVGVAYSSDVQLVSRLLLQAAAEHPLVQKEPAPKVAFRDFGDSALRFSLYYFSEEFLANEFVKSDLRFAIEALFREHDVRIPFPQRDLWLRNPDDLRPQS
jgi:small-conductance mechanosensitive channel